MSGLFSKFHTLERALAQLKSQAFREVGNLDIADLAEATESTIASRIVDRIVVGVSADFAARFATKHEEPDRYSTEGTLTTVVYHIPASGQLGLLESLPEGVQLPDLEMQLDGYVNGLSGLPGRGGGYPIYDGEICYELSAAMSSEIHNATAKEMATTIEAGCVAATKQIHAFKTQLLRDVQVAIAERRRREEASADTLGGLDVPLR